MARIIRSDDLGGLPELTVRAGEITLPSTFVQDAEAARLFCDSTTWVQWICPNCQKSAVECSCLSRAIKLNGTTTISAGWTCPNCGAYVLMNTSHSCPCTFGNGTSWRSEGAGDGPNPPGILSDIPAMRERAERVRARAEHKDLDGLTARLLAADVLALIEALEELT